MTTLEKYCWLIGKLYTCNRKMTLSELSDALQDKTGETLDRQKLKRWRDDILDSFNIQINCKKEGGKYYYFIENPEEIDGKSVESWILSSATLSNTLNTYKNLKDRIVCDAIPKGIEHLESLLHAMSANIAVDITYRGIGGSEWTFRAEPYALRQHQGQWYLLCKIQNLASLVIYSLSQITDIHFRKDDTFTISSSFDAEEYFAPYFGIVVNSNLERTQIVIRAYGNKIAQLRTKPLHSSQNEILNFNGEYSDFEFNIVPTYDFIHSIMGMGPMVEVISPFHFVVDVLRVIRAIKGRYGKNTRATRTPSEETLVPLNGNFVVLVVNRANNSSSSICYLVAIIVKEGKIVRKFQSYVKPIPFILSDNYTAINGLTETEFFNAPTFPEVWSQIENDICNLPIVHADDYSFTPLEISIKAAFDAYGMEWHERKFYGVLKAAKKIFGKEIRLPRLDIVAGATGASATKEKCDSLSRAEEITAIALQVL